MPSRETRKSIWPVATSDRPVGTHMRSRAATYSSAMDRKVISSGRRRPEDVNDAAAPPVTADFLDAPAAGVDDREVGGVERGGRDEGFGRRVAADEPRAMASFMRSRPREKPLETPTSARTDSGKTDFQYVYLEERRGDGWSV